MHNALEPSEPDEMVVPVDEDTCRVYLGCGHWSSPISSRSSHFDFPEDPLDCPTCCAQDKPGAKEAGRQMHPLLQTALYLARQDGAL